jgi:peptide/nickel transport system ATP-binding protein
MSVFDGTQSVLAVDHLVKQFQIGRGRARSIVHAVNDVSFQIREREIFGLAGESGSGKTTVARVIARLYTETSGGINLGGELMPKTMRRKELLDFRKRVQMIFQDPFSSLNPLHTVRHILRRPLVVHHIVRRDRIDDRVVELLEECGLRPAASFIDKYPHELSGGQRQRVGIARALAVKPLLLLADEPTSMLDVSIRLDIMNLILDLKEKENIACLFVTHDLAGAHYISDRLAVLYAGVICETGPSDEVINDPLHPYTQLLRTAAPKPELGLRPDPIDIPGDVPDLTAIPPGCPFAPRCPRVMDACRSGLPPLIPIGEERFVRCVLYRRENL